MSDSLRAAPCPRDEPGRSRLSAGTLAACVAIVVCGLALRLVQPRESLWLDELHTAWTISDGVREMPVRAARGNTSPLYFVLPWLSVSVLGDSELALRVPSVVCGAALIAATFLLVRNWTGDALAAGLAAVLVAIDRNCLFYSGEARVYGCVQLVGLAHVWLFARLVAAPRRWLHVGFVALSVTLFYLHYTTILLLAAELVWYAGRLLPVSIDRTGVHLRRGALLNGSWKAMLIDVVILVVLCLPAVEHLRDVASRKQNWNLFIAQQPATAIFTLLPLYVYLLAPLVALAICAVVRFARCSAPIPTQIPPEASGSEISRAATSGLTMLTICWLFVPLVIAWGTTATDSARIFFPRYLAVTFAAPPILTALAMHGCRPVMVRWLLAAVVIWLSVDQSGIAAQYLHDGRLLPDRHQNWRGAIEAINSSDQSPAAPVFLRSGLIEAETANLGDADERAYCLLPVRGLYRLTNAAGRLVQPVATRAARPTAAQIEAARSAGGMWLITCSDRRTANYLESRFLGFVPRPLRARAARQRWFGTVGVIWIEIRPPGPAPGNAQAKS